MVDVLDGDCVEEEGSVAGGGAGGLEHEFEGELVAATTDDHGSAGFEVGEGKVDEFPDGRFEGVAGFGGF